MSDTPSHIGTDLNAALNIIVDGVIIIDGKGIIRKYNPACTKIFGYSSDEVVGQNIKCLMPEPYKAEHDNYLSNYQSSGIAKVIGIGREVKGARKDGRIFPMYLSVGELPSKDGRIFIGIIRDLSTEAEQREKYDILQQSNFHLSRVAAMDQMGTAIAHEINQPLSAIMNYLEAGITIIEREDKDRYHLLENIMKRSANQADRAAKILFRLRQFIETGDVEKQLHPLAEIIQSSLDLIQPAYKNNDIEFVTLIEENLPDLLMSDVQLQQVFVNLLRNACEALDGQDLKRITIKAEIESPLIVKVSILDTGKGMTDAQFEKLYEPFSSDKAGGLGVGLSISQSIISNHEGRLWAERNTPQGTCFNFTLPIPTGG